MPRKIKDAVSHPLTVFSAAFVSLTQLLGLGWLDAFGAVIWGNLAQIFTAVSIGAFTVVPNVGLPFAFIGQALQFLAVTLGIAYALKLGLGVYEQFETRL